MIDLSSFPKIGTMTKGSGIAGVFDGSVGTTGYAEFSGGYAGVNFSSSPQKIDRVEVVPATNGFDASGLTTAIVLTLRAKNGSAPTGPNDGTVLATASFTDVNAQTARTLTSSDRVTAWDFVWVTVTTGVWSVIAELRFFEAGEYVPPVSPDPSPAVITVYQKACNSSFPLPQTAIIVPDFTFDVCCDEAGVALVDFKVNVTHVGNLFSPSYLGAIGIGAQFYYKFSADYDGLDAAPWLSPANSRTNGINIDERNPAHYANVGLNTSMPVQPGFYRFSLSMSAHTDGDGRGGLAQILAEGGKGLNGLRVSIIKGGAFFDKS